MRFASTRLIARDIEVLVSFYEKLTDEKAEWLAPVFAEIVTPAATLAFGTAETVATPGGTLVGVLPESHFTPATVVLKPGETLLLYTDGLFESRIKAGPRYSEKALHAFALVEEQLGIEIDIAVLDHHPEQVRDIVHAACDAHALRSAPDDNDAA